MRKLNSEIVLNWNSISHQVWSNIEKDNAENNQVDKLQLDVWYYTKNRVRWLGVRKTGPGSLEKQYVKHLFQVC